MFGLMYLCTEQICNKVNTKNILGLKFQSSKTTSKHHVNKHMTSNSKVEIDFHHSVVSLPSVTCEKI